MVFAEACLTFAAIYKHCWSDELSEIPVPSELHFQNSCLYYFTLGKSASESGWAKAGPQLFKNAWQLMVFTNCLCRANMVKNVAC